MGALEGKTVIVTRAREQAGEFTAFIESRGARAIVIPTIEIVPPLSWEEADGAIKEIAQYHWLVFTSANGVKFFLERVRSTQGGLGGLAGRSICAIGPWTGKALEKEGLNVDFMPTEYVAEALIEQSGEIPWEGRKVLLPRATEAREVVPEQLRRLGAAVDVVPVYRTIRPPVSREEFRKVLGSGGADAIAFTSASTVRNFVELFPEGEAKALLGTVAVAAIGPVTAGKAGEYGVETDVMPKEYTIPALTEALERYFENGAQSM